jgi:phosphoribosylformylglycinamidine synthase I
MANVSLIVFPGSNCDHDIEYALAIYSGVHVNPVWHTETSLPQSDLVLLPGGFSFGDYLRTGALAKISPIMKAVKAYAEGGGAVLGICNGFQILCEAGLLPGALLRNRRGKFLSQFVYLKAEESCSSLYSGLLRGKSQTPALLRWPIAHGEGNYYCSSETLEELRRNRQIVFTYCNQAGDVEPESAESNPNGSLQAIAGICNRQGNVCGLMPHPERVVDSLVSPGADCSGKSFFAALLARDAA